MIKEVCWFCGEPSERTVCKKCYPKYKKIAEELDREFNALPPNLRPPQNQP